MKYLIFLAFILFSSTAKLLATDTTLLNKYLKEKDFFRMERLLSLKKSRLSSFSQLYYSVFTLNAFNKNKFSNEAINKLYRLYQANLDRNKKLQLLKTSIDNNIKLFEYKSASGEIDLLLRNYSEHLDSSEIDEWRNESIIFNLLQSTPKQTTHIKADVVFTYTRDISNLINIPVSANSNSSHDFIFDTGANFSAISDSFSKKMNLKIFPASIFVNSFTGQKLKARIGVAKSIKIGAAEIKNIVFIVLPDKDLIFPLSPTKNYIINGVIGYPVIAQLGEIDFLPGNKLLIPKTPAVSEKHNLAFSGLTPVVELLVSKTDTLPFHFDTGAGQTILYKNYFSIKQESIVSNSSKSSSAFGGAGGSAIKNTYTIPEFKVDVIDKSAILKNIKVLTTDSEEFYGTIGQDLIKSFQVMRINFKNMTLKFE